MHTTFGIHNSQFTIRYPNLNKTKNKNEKTKTKAQPTNTSMYKKYIQPSISRSQFSL